MVQTFWEGNDAHEEMSGSVPDAVQRRLRQTGLDIRRPDHHAFFFCAYRLRNYLDGLVPGSRWRIVADEGIRRSGQNLVLPLRWSNGAAMHVQFDDSSHFKMLQMADFVSFFMNRSQQFLARTNRTQHDEELLDLIGANWNYVNIPIKAIPRQFPI